MRVSLHDVAPRLAVARDLRSREVAVIDGPGFKIGDDFYKILTHRHSTGPCRGCGRLEDRYATTTRILVGVNAGTVGPNNWSKCRRCGAEAGSNYRKPWGPR